MSEERPLQARLFYVQYGKVGQKSNRSALGVEMWRARRGAMGIAVAARDAYRESGNELAAGLLQEVIERLKMAQSGALLDGYCIEFTVGEDERYIAVVPKGKPLSFCKTTERGWIDGDRVHVTAHGSLTALTTARTTPGRALTGMEMQTAPTGGPSRKQRQVERERMTARDIGAAMAKAAKEALDKEDA